MKRNFNCVSPGRSFVCLALLLSLANAVVAQDPDDPFGGGDGAMDASSTFGSVDDTDMTPTSPAAGGAAGGAPTSYLNTDPLIRRVRENPPSSPPEMAKAITWMVQLRSWETVGNLLDRVDKQNWSLESKAQLAREIAPEIWNQLLRNTGKLSEAQSKSLKSLYSAPVAYGRDPKVIDSLIDQLASPMAASRQIAQLRLQDGQRAALKRVLDRLIDGDAKVPAKSLAETALQFDRDGIDALQAACNLQDATRSSRVALSLAELSSNKFSSELAAALYSGRYSADVKQALAEKIQAGYSRLPSQAAVVDFLAKEFQNALDDYQSKRIAADSTSRTIWLPAADGKIFSREVTPALAALERLAQLACMRSQLEVVDPAVETLSTVIQLQRAYQLNPSLIDAEITSQLIQPLPSERSEEAAFWVEVFKQASDRQMHGAAIRSLQMLHSQVRSGKFLAPLDFLSQLLLDGRPVVRYLALEIIATADPRADYSASERALAVAVEMTQMSQGPQALVIGGNNELCMAADQLIQLHTGTKSVVVTSARGAFKNLVQQHPIELIVVVDRVHDLTLFEMLQRLRGSGSLPIAVLVDRLQPHEEDLVNKGAGFYAANLSRDPDHLKLVIEQLTQTLDVRPMTSDDRIRFSALAGKFLTKIAADRNNYAFYPVTEWHEQMVSITSVVQPSARAQLLSGLGTQDSQQKLVLLACSTGLPEKDRFQAARSFETSVRQFGIQLSDQEIKNSYERYNDLGPNDPAIAKAMGYVLDIIEAQTGTRAWPDPL